MAENQVQPETFTDETLMNRLANGDSWALGQVYHRYGDDVRRLLIRTQPVAFAADVDDICHDVFLTVHRKAVDYVHMDKLRSWIYKIALQEARAQRRKKWVRDKLFRQFVREKKATSIETELLVVPDENTGNRMSAAIASLTPGQREILMLAVEEKMTGQEIAKTLGIEHNAVRAKLFRARQSIAKSLNLDVATLGGKKKAGMIK